MIGRRFMCVLVAQILLAGPGAGLPATATQARLDRIHIVACAPGYAANRVQAQPTMDQLATTLAAAAGWPQERLSAEYEPDEQAGVAALQRPETAVALVPLPFFLEYERALDLRPLAQVIDTSDRAAQPWSLAAPVGRIGVPADLADWEVLGVPAYSEAFVRGLFESSWGALPESAHVAFTGRVLGALRRAIAGEAVAVLLDADQVAALVDFPGGDKLEIVAESASLPAALAVEVGGRLDPATRAQLVAALLRLADDEAFAGLETTLGLSGFVAPDEDGIASARAMRDRRLQ